MARKPISARGKKHRKHIAPRRSLNSRIDALKNYVLVESPIASSSSNPFATNFALPLTKDVQDATVALAKFKATDAVIRDRSPIQLPLPPQLFPRPTLVLDLDNTLIHAIPKRPRPGVPYSYDEEFDVVLRPGVENFLRDLSHVYELVLFTAGVKGYAEWILNKYLDPERKIFSYVLDRDHVSYKPGPPHRPHQKILYKDLSMMGRDLSKVVFLDDLSDNFCEQPDNGIEVLKFQKYDLASDKELEFLKPLLMELASVEDIRPRIAGMYGPQSSNARRKVRQRSDVPHVYRMKLKAPQHQTQLVESPPSGAPQPQLGPPPKLAPAQPQLEPPPSRLQPLLKFEPPPQPPPRPMWSPPKREPPPKLEPPPRLEPPPLPPPPKPPMWAPKLQHTPKRAPQPPPWWADWEPPPTPQPQTTRAPQPPKRAPSTAPQPYPRTVSQPQPDPRKAPQPQLNPPLKRARILEQPLGTEWLTNMLKVACDAIGSPMPKLPWRKKEDN